MEGNVAEGEPQEPKNVRQDVGGIEAEKKPQEQTPKIFKYGRRALYSLWTMVCPPLFLDWEEILRHYTDSDIFDKKPWERELPKDLGKVYINIKITLIHM